jgi:hypothetical protein
MTVKLKLGGRLATGAVVVGSGVWALDHFGYLNMKPQAPVSVPDKIELGERLKSPGLPSSKSMI